MIVIITGKIDSGKTTRLLSIYNEFKAGDGFIIKKIYEKENYIGQNVILLSTGERKTFSLKKGYLPQYWDELYHYGPYSFSRQGFTFANNIILNTLRMNVEPVYIDEVGPLELEGKGFSNILTLALASKKDIYLTVRETCLNDVAIKFNISDFKVIKV